MIAGKGVGDFLEEIQPVEKMTHDNGPLMKRRLG
jgi:hypothetical protein